ncbi:MAG: hypothetical protein LKK18_06755 [Clostridiales bacterium]|jgi:hypothetical protein|nr:hypothetical protein [Clostridiales bacterium]
MLNAVLNIIVILVVVAVAIIKAVIIDAPTESRMIQTVNTLCNMKEPRKRSF